MRINSDVMTPKGPGVAWGQMVSLDPDGTVVESGKVLVYLREAKKTELFPLADVEVLAVAHREASPAAIRRGLEKEVAELTARLDAGTLSAESKADVLSQLRAAQAALAKAVQS